MPDPFVDSLTRYFDDRLATALRDWASGLGGTVRLPSRPWVANGHTGTVLAAIILQRQRTAEKIIVKVCPPNRYVREAGSQELAFTPSHPFAKKYLVRPLYPPYPVGDGRSLLFQDVASGSLLDSHLLSELPAPDLIDICTEMVGALLNEWNGPNPEVASSSVRDYLKNELGESLHAGGPAREWADSLGLMDPGITWISTSEDGMDRPMPNPLLLVGEHSLTRDMTIDYLIGRAHGDLHLDNVVIPRLQEPGRFRLIDLSGFSSAAPLTRDLVALILAIVARDIQELPSDQQEALLGFVITPTERPPLALPGILTNAIWAIYDAGLRFAGRWLDEWQAQYLLSLLASALVYVSFDNIGQDGRWWFFRLAASAGGEFLRRQEGDTAPAAPRLIRPQHGRTDAKLLEFAAPPLHRLDPRYPLRGRDDLLGELLEALQRGTGSRVRVLHGLGGCGKTSIALHLAHQAHLDGVETWWVEAGGGSPVDTGMRAVARRLGAVEEELRHSAEDALWQRLRRRTRPWLLVVDGANDPSVVLSQQADIAPHRGWLRRLDAGPGLIVVTSRDGSSESWGSWAQLHPVETLSATDGAAVLRDLAENVGKPDEAEALARRLGGLPLALRLAGAYLARVNDMPWAYSTGSARTFSEYRAALDIRLAELFADTDAPLEVDEALRTITTAWEMSLDLVAQRGSPGSRPLLRLLSCFGNTPIPFVLLLNPDVLATSSFFQGMSRQQLWDNLQALASVRLIEFARDEGTIGRHTETITLHPLVRATNRGHAVKTGEYPAYLDLTTTLLQNATEGLDPDKPICWPTWQILAPHCAAHLKWLVSANVQVRPDATDPAFRAACYLRARGMYAQAEAEFRAILAARNVVRDATSVLNTRHQLATVLRATGKLREAENEYRAILRARREAYGEDHPETLATRYQLGRVLRACGLLAAAQQEFETVLEAQRRRYGDDGLETLTTRHQHARILRARGELHQADEEFGAILEALNRLDPNGTHPFTLATRHHRARVWRALGRFHESEAEFRAVLDTQERMFGKDHPDTLATRHQCARSILSLGRVADAEATFGLVLDLRRRQLGDDHPDTLTTRAQRARVLRMQGRLDEAEAELCIVIETRQHILGEDHPDTLAARHLLADVAWDRSDFGRATFEYKEVLSAQTRVLGRNHPDTLATRHNLVSLALAQSYGALDIVEAEGELRAVLEARRSILGSDHPQTLSTQTKLAVVIRLAGRTEEACTQLREIVDRQQRTLGEYHADTLATRRYLVEVLHSLGLSAEAYDELQVALRTVLKILSEHSNEYDGTRCQCASHLIVAHRADTSTRTGDEAGGRSEL